MQDGLLARAADEGEFRLLVAGSHCKRPSRWAAFKETQKRDNLFYQIKCKPFQRFGFRIFAPFSLYPPLLLPFPPVWIPPHKGKKCSKLNADRCSHKGRPPSASRGSDGGVGGTIWEAATAAARGIRREESAQVPTPHFHSQAGLPLGPQA